MTLEERIPIKVLFDRKDAAEWQKLNPVVDDGELVVELDTHRLKVGDGKLNYNDLPYYEGPQGESITKVQLSENGDLSVWIGDKETKLGNIKGQKGDKGTSIADITKVGETLTITLSDDTQKNFSIPNGQKGDRGKGVESARVDEEGNLFVKFEEESEKLVGNIKGQKGDKGDSLKFEDLTSDQIAQIKAKDVDLSAYATKAELKEIDVSKQLADYLSKAEANSTYAKASHKHSLSDITDLNLDRYATKIELQNKASTYHRHRTSDIDGIDEYLKQTDLPQDIVKQSDIRDVVRNAQLSGYVRLADIQYQLNNIGKLKDVATGQYLSVRVVDKGKVPYNTSGLIVFERSGGK
ncbi:hyaluronate lyase N-terminal domain-containing protein [Streptococcus pyogenes]